MSFIKLFAEQELGGVDNLRGSYRGQLNQDFVHLIFSDKNIYVVKPEGLSGNAYEIMRSVPTKDLGEVKKLDDKKLQLIIDGEKHQFGSVMKADMILKSINDLKKA